MPTLPPLFLAQVALTQDAARLFPAVRDAVNAADTEGGPWLARFATADAHAAHAAQDLARAVRLRPGLRDDAYALGRSLALEGNVAGDRRRRQAGGSLATVMSPDPFLPTNWPEYLEGYCFDHVVVSGNSVWALPQPIAIDPGGPGGEDITRPFAAFRVYVRT